MSPEDELLAPFVDAMREERWRHRLELDGRGNYECSCGWSLPHDHGLPGDAQRDAWNAHVEDCVLRAALSVEPTKACETCGGKGYDDELGPRHEDWVPCSGCDDGRVPDPEGVRLALVKPEGWQFVAHDGPRGRDIHPEPAATSFGTYRQLFAVHPETGSENR